MARKRSVILTDAELRLMKVLWARKLATVAEVVEALRGQVAYSTVQTILGILERKGYIVHQKMGRAFLYRPVIDRQQARRRAVGHLVKRLFDDSPSLLVLDLLSDERINADEMQRLKKLIEEA